ncbi:protein phosphatase regulator [Rhodotorula toruloides]
MSGYQYPHEPSAADYDYHGGHYQGASGVAGGSGGLPVSITRSLRNQGGLSINVGEANKGDVDQAHAAHAVMNHEQYDAQQYEHVDRGFDGDEEGSFHEGSDEEVAEALQGGQHRFRYQQHHDDEMHGGQGMEHDVDDEEVEGAEEDLNAGEFSDSLSSSPSIPDEDIDFGLVYALHTFLATVDGQASVVKGDKLLLLDDSNSYWWLVRVLKTQAIGYIPAENIETPWERLARLNKHRNVDLTSATQQDVITGPTSSSARTRFISRIPPSQQPNPHESRHPFAKGVPASPSHKDHPRNISPPPFVGRPGSSKAKTVGFAAPTYYAHSATGMTDEEGEEDGEGYEEGMDVEGDEGDELDRHPAEGFEEDEEEDGLRAGAREESEFSDDHEHHQGAASGRQEHEGVFADGEAEGEETDGEADDEDDTAEARRGRSPYDEALRPSSSASAQGTDEAAKRQHWERESAAALQAQEQAAQAEAHWKRERDAQGQQQRALSPRVDSIGAAQGRRPLSPADANLQQHAQRLAPQDGLSPRTRQTDNFGLSPTQPGPSSLASSTRSSRFDENDFLDSEAPTKKLTATPPIARDEDASRFDDNLGRSPTSHPQLLPGGQPPRQVAQQPLRVRGVDLVDPRDPRYNRMLQPTKQAGEDLIYERVVADAQRQQRMQAQVDGGARNGSLDYGVGNEGDASFGSVDTHTSSISEGVGASGSKKGQQAPTTTEKKRKSGGGILGLFRKKDKKKKGDSKDENVVRSSEDSGVLSPTSTAFRRSGSISPVTAQQAPNERTSSRSGAPTAESMFSTDAALRQQELEAKQALYHQYGVSRAPGDITNTMTPRGQPGGLSVSDAQSQSRLSVEGTGSKRNSLQLLSHPASVVGPTGSLGSPSSLGPAGQRMRPGSLIGSPSIPGLEVPLLSVMRVFAGANIDSDATFKTVLLNQSTNAADLVKQAMQRFRLTGADLTRDDFYLTVKELGGDERPLHDIEKPLEIFEELSERAGDESAFPPNVRRSSVGSINSISSNLSLNPAIARSGVNDWSDDSAVKFYLHRRGNPDSPLVGQTPLDGAEDSFAQHSSEHDTASDHTATPQLGVPQNAPSYRFAVRLLIHPGDLPENVVFDPASNAIIPKAVLAERQQRNGGFSEPQSPSSLSSSQQPREKIIFFPKNANVSEVIETALDRFGIVDGVVDGGDEVEDRVSRRRSVTRVKYSLAVLHEGKESFLNASSKLLDAYTAPPLFKAYDRSSKEFRRRSADTSLILGSSADVQTTDPVFVIRRSPLRSTAGRGGVLPQTIDELEELQQRRQAEEDDEQEVLRGSPNPATGPRSHRDIIAAQRAASRANQQAILSAQKNGEQGYDIAIRDQGTIRSARDVDNDEVRYSYVDESGAETDISRIVENEWQSKGRPGPPPDPVEMHRPTSSFSRTASAATTTDADSFRTAPSSLPDGAMATDNESLADDDQQAIEALRSTNLDIDSPVSAFAPEVSPSVASFKTAMAVPPAAAHEDVLKDALGPRPTTSPALDENLQDRLERVLARVKEEKARRAASPTGANVRPRSFMSSSTSATPTGRFSPVNVGIRSASAMGGRRSPFGDGMRDAPSINQLMSQSTPPASTLPRDGASAHAKKDSIASVTSTASTTTDQLSTPVTGISSGFTPASSANSNHRPQIVYRDDFGYDTLLAIVEADSHAPARQPEQVSPEDAVLHSLFGRGLDSVPDLHPEVRSAYEGPAKALDDLDARLDSLLVSLASGRPRDLSPPRARRRVLSRFISLPMLEEELARSLARLDHLNQLLREDEASLKQQRAAHAAFLRKYPFARTAPPPEPPRAAPTQTRTAPVEPKAVAPTSYGRGEHPNSKKNLALGRGRYWPRRERSPSPPAPSAHPTSGSKRPRTDTATSQTAKAAREPIATVAQRSVAAMDSNPSPAPQQPASRPHRPRYLNRYVAPGPLEERLWHLTTPLEEYDLNFAFDLPPYALVTDGVVLTPLIPCLHARRLYRLYSTHTAGFAYLPYGPFPTFESFLTFIEIRRRQTGSFLFVVYDRLLEFDDGRSEVDGLREERIAGIVGIKSSEPERMAEIGHLHIPAPFQRSHIFTHAAYLLLQWLFSSPFPSIPPGSHPFTTLHGLGLRRVQWAAGSRNTASINAALRLGFQMEASDQQWERPLAKDRGKVEGLELPEFVQGQWREREEGIGLGRHSALLSMAWDRWENEGRAKLEMMAAERGVVRRKAKDVLGDLL